MASEDTTSDEPEEEKNEMAKKDTEFEGQVFRELGRGYAHMTDEEVARNVQSRIEAAKGREGRRKR